MQNEGKKPIAIAVIGTGPAGLMAATVLSGYGFKVHVFEMRNGPARKLLIAGSSGLNISNNLPAHEFAAQYTGDGIKWHALLAGFSLHDWRSFIGQMGFETFEGTSGRLFLRGMKASGFLRAWLKSLTDANVQFHYGHEWLGLVPLPAGGYELQFAERTSFIAAGVVFSLGGGSWLPTGQEMRAMQWFAKNGLQVIPFTPANCGFQVAWKKEFVAEAAHKPLKNIEFHSARGSKKGDLVITPYGIEGTPVYTYGQAGLCYLDLKPDLAEAEVLQRLLSLRENLAPLRRAKKTLGLSETALALLFHHAPAQSLRTPAELAAGIKRFPLELTQPRPLAEAISSGGGLALSEITETFELRKFPNAYAVGEMLDWSAPTGGFLIHGCVAQGAAAGRALARNWPDARHTP